MKKFVVILSFVTINGFAQTNYNIVEIGSKYTASQIEAALEGADLCGFYYKNEKRVLMFDDGSLVELNDESGLTELDENCFIEKSPAHSDEYWEISPNGHLIRRIQTVGK